MDASRLSSFNSKNVDFSNPSAQMIQDAKIHGIDLTDKRVQQIMHEMNLARGDPSEGETLSPTNSNNKKNISEKSSDNTKERKPKINTKESPEEYLKSAMTKIYKDEASKLAQRMLSDLNRQLKTDMLIKRQMYTYTMNNTEDYTDEQRAINAAKMRISFQNTLHSILATYDDDKISTELSELIVSDVVEIRLKYDTGPDMEELNREKEAVVVEVGGEDTRSSREDIDNASSSFSTVNVTDNTEMANREITLMLEARYYSMLSGEMMDTSTTSSTTAVTMLDALWEGLFKAKNMVVILGVTGVLFLAVFTMLYGKYTPDSYQPVQVHVPLQLKNDK